MSDLNTEMLEVVSQAMWLRLDWDSQERRRELSNLIRNLSDDVLLAVEKTGVVVSDTEVLKSAVSEACKLLREMKGTSTKPPGVLARQVLEEALNKVG